MRPLLCSHVAVLAAQVTSLAGLGLGSIADGHLAALIGVKVSLGGGAVAILWDGQLVDVVHEGTTLSWKTRNGELEVDASSVGGGGSRKRAAEGAAGLLRKSSNIANASGVASDDRSRSAGLGADNGRSREDRDDLGEHFDVVVPIKVKN